ncbi:MAG: hypothetical protein WAL63_15655 [Solirubrobacteraceae bacterium]
MTLNPIRTFWNRKADRIHAEGGWGPLRTWPVPREGKDPLVFQMRLPLTMELVDIGTLAANAPGAPQSVEQGALEIARVAPIGGIILTGALRETKPDTPPEILATMTVAFSDIAGPPDVDAHIGSDAADDVRPPEVEKLSDRATRISRLQRVLPPDADELWPLLTIQYLIQSRYGAVAYAYATTRPGMIFGEGGRGLFRMITEGGYIGERPQTQ